MTPATERVVSRSALILAWCAWGGLVVFVVRGRGADVLRNFGAGQIALFAVCVIALATSFVLHLRSVRRGVAENQPSAGRLREAENAPVLASFRGGAWLGNALGCSSPLAKLVVKHGVVELSVPLMATLRFDVTKVRRVESRGGFLSSRVRFEFADGAPPIVFTTGSRDAVVSVLRRAGYTGA